MKTSRLDKAKIIIDKRRFEAENKAISNKIKALEDPKFKQYYQDYISQMIDATKKGENLSDKTNKLKSLYIKRLNELGIDSIEPIYFCNKCNDTGFIDGKYCSCLIKEVNQILKEESGFSNFESFDEADFTIFKDGEYMKKLYDKMKKWCHSKFDKNIIYIAGDTGVGKTHLIRCMANELINLNHVVFLTSSFSMHQDFIKSYSTKDLEEKNALLDKYLDCEILFIDDLGTELRQYNITVNYLYQVINERKIKKLPTIITSNLKLDDIKDYYDERISSRIIDKTSSICVYIEGDDVRLKVKK